MQQGWIEWAKVCKLTILHDLATFLPGVLIITMSSVDIVMMRGVCFISYVLQTLSKPCLSLSFAFIWKAKCLLLLLPPCHDQDHFHTAWGWDNPYTLPPHPTPPHPALPLLCASTSVIYFMIWFFFLSPTDKIIFHIFFSLSIMPSYGLFELEMVCIVWEVCVFVHLPSYWMLWDDCSRLSDVKFILSFSTATMLL